METEKQISILETAPRQEIIPSAIESLLHGDSINNPWPQEIIKNQELQEQIAIRHTLSKKLDSFFSKIPRATTTIPEGLEKGLIKEEDVTELYNAMSNLLEADTANKQLVLYLPFELLPSESMMPSTRELSEASARLSREIKQAWNEMLSVHTLRENFAKGDIPEQKHRTEELPQVVKAAHLIPMLLEHGILSLHEILLILENTKDDVLANSITDGLLVAGDMNLLSHEELQAMSSSHNQRISNMATIIIMNQAHIDKKVEANTHAIHFEEALTTTEKMVEQKALDIQKQYGDEDRRGAWLKQEALQKIVEKNAHRIAEALQNNLIAPGTITRYLTEEGSSVRTLFALQVVQDSLEAFARKDVSQAVLYYAHYHDYIKNLLEKSTNPALRNKIEELLHHLQALHIVNDETLLQLGIRPESFVPSFEGRTTNNRKQEALLGTLVTSIENNKELLALIYPIVILLGSRMKGYAKDEADIDVAVFVKPGVRFGNRENLQRLIKETFVHDKVQGEAMEFWLEKTGDEMSIQNFENPDTKLGDSILAHTLTGTWCGDTASIEELYQQLMPSYLYSEGATVLGESFRTIVLGEIERDTLQYRLMHKGYKHFFPEQGGITTTNSDAIDSTSTFYDSGYRRLATQLFVDKVFLPQLHKQEKKA